MTKSLILKSAKQLAKKPPELSALPIEEQTLAYKQSVLNGLVTTIGMLQRPLSLSEQEKVQALEYSQTMRLNRLVEECKQRELEIKIEQMRKLIAILKNNTFSL
jgi:hypothetical protein